MVQHDYSYTMPVNGNHTTLANQAGQQLASTPQQANVPVNSIQQAQTNQYLNSNSATLANKIGSYIQNIHSYSIHLYSPQQQQQQHQQPQQFQHASQQNFNQSQLLHMQQQYHNQQLQQHQQQQDVQQNAGFPVAALAQQPQAPVQSTPAPFHLNMTGFNYQQQMPQNQYTTLANVNSNGQNNLAALAWNPNFLRSLTVASPDANVANAKTS